MRILNDKIFHEFIPGRNNIITVNARFTVYFRISAHSFHKIFYKRQLAEYNFKAKETLILIFVKVFMLSDNDIKDGVIDVEDI